jgi:integrase
MPNAKMSIKEFVEKQWLPSLDAAEAGGSLKPTTVAFYRHIVHRHVVVRLGGVKLSSLSAPMLNSFYGDLLRDGRGAGGAGLSPTTVARVHVTVHRFLRDAVRWGVLQRNVADQATAPRPIKRKMAPWSPRETGQFLATTRGTRLSALWQLAAMTGLRRGEVCGLRWCDVDLEQRRLTVARARVMAGGQVVSSSPKTVGSARTIGLDELTASVLRAHRSRQNEWRLAAGEAWMGDDTIFTDELGRPLHPTAVSKFFKAAAHEAGMPLIRFHDLRHGYATAALEAGAAMKVVSERLGHRSISITADVYSHVRPEVDQALADEVAAIIAEAAR